MIKNFPKHIKKGNKYFITNNSEADYSGIYLGEEKKGTFIPSLMLLEIIQDKLSTITISNKAEWLFSCGKNILPDSILEKEDKGTDLIIVLNKKKETLGLCVKKEVYENIFDLGYYLRRELKKAN